MLRAMQDDEKETPKQGDNAKTQRRINGQFAPSVSKATLIQALDEYIMGAPSGELCERYGIPPSTFLRFRQRAGVPATGRLVRTDRVEQWREAYERHGNVEGVKQECGGDKYTIIRELGIESAPDPEPEPKEPGNLLWVPEKLSDYQRWRVRQLRGEVMSEVSWVFPGSESALQALQSHDDVWWWRRLNWTIGEWYECSQTPA